MAILFCCMWRLTSVLLSGRSADGPAIVAADEDDRSAQGAGKVDSSVEVPFRGCTFSKVHCHTCLLAIQLYCTRADRCYLENDSQKRDNLIYRDMKRMHIEVNAVGGERVDLARQDQTSKAPHAANPANALLWTVCI